MAFCANGLMVHRPRGSQADANGSRERAPDDRLRIVPSARPRRAAHQGF